jgi:hypothetical protein
MKIPKTQDDNFCLNIVKLGLCDVEAYTSVPQLGFIEKLLWALRDLKIELLKHEGSKSLNGSAKFFLA